MSELEQLKGLKGLIICSAGGHLTEALLLTRKLQIAETSCFITHKNSQAESLIGNLDFEFVTYVKSRQIFNAIKTYFEIRRIAKAKDFDFILSTGAAISLSALFLHLSTMKPYYYNELLTRVKGPSASGKILELFSSVKLFSPHSKNFSSKWKASPQILEDYYKEEIEVVPTERLSVFVSLGTMSPYRFDRIIDSLLPALSKNDDVTWQLGCTTRDDLPGTCVTIIENQRFLELASRADVVVCHSGVGSLLDLIEQGIRPIVLPRLARFGEHVDDHQIELAQYFEKLDLVHLPEGTISRSDLFKSRRFRITTKQNS